MPASFAYYGEGHEGPVLYCLVCGAIIVPKFQLEHESFHTYIDSGLRNIYDALAAIQEKIGIDYSEDPESIDYRLRALENDPGDRWY
jgi:hypothetical protein